MWRLIIPRSIVGAGRDAAYPMLPHRGRLCRGRDAATSRGGYRGGRYDLSFLSPELAATAGVLGAAVQLLVCTALKKNAVAFLSSKDHGGDIEIVILKQRNRPFKTAQGISAVGDATDGFMPTLCRAGFFGGSVRGQVHRDLAVRLVFSLTVASTQQSRQPNARAGWPNP